MTYRRWFVVGAAFAVIGALVAAFAIFYGSFSPRGYVEDQLHPGGEPGHRRGTPSRTPRPGSPSQVAKEITDAWQPADQYVDGSGVYLRYDDDSVVILPIAAGSVILLERMRTAYPRYHSTVGSHWGWGRGSTGPRRRPRQPASERISPPTEHPGAAVQTLVTDLLVTLAYGVVGVLLMAHRLRAGRRRHPRQAPRADLDRAQPQRGAAARLQPGRRRHHRGRRDRRQRGRLRARPGRRVRVRDRRPGHHGGRRSCCSTSPRRASSASFWSTRSRTRRSGSSRSCTSPPARSSPPRSADDHGEAARRQPRSRHTGAWVVVIIARPWFVLWLRGSGVVNSDDGSTAVPRPDPRARRHRADPGAGQPPARASATAGG